MHSRVLEKRDMRQSRTAQELGSYFHFFSLIYG